MITLKKLQWDNCFSYGSNNSIDLNDTTVTQLLGKNGAGKSSIPLILEEVLSTRIPKALRKLRFRTENITRGIIYSLIFLWKMKSTE